MDTEAAFIAAMAADPENNLPRLVFADWLEENGDPDRAEFIRLQCDPTADDAATARAEELLAANHERWEVPFRRCGWDIQFQRGFPYHLKATFHQLVEHQQSLALAPAWILTPCRDEDDESDDSQAELCSQISNGPLADRICGLNLTWHWCTGDELDALLSETVLPRLRELWFRDQGDIPQRLRYLCGQHDLRLETLAFLGDSYTGIADDGCLLLAHSPIAAHLRALEVPNNGITNFGIRALAASPFLTQLRRLDLQGGSNSSNEIGPGGAEAIATSANFRQLKHLDVVHNRIGDDGFIELVWSPHLVSLQSLNVPGNGITDEGLFALTESDQVLNLNWLNLCACEITIESIRALLESDRIPRMKGLRFSDTELGDEVVELFAQNPACQNLTELLLSQCGISFNGYTRLLESPNLARVKQFDLQLSGLADTQIEALRARFGKRIADPISYPLD